MTATFAVIGSVEDAIGDAITEEARSWRNASN
jgi:hypothetical protein